MCYSRRMSCSALILAAIISTTTFVTAGHNIHSFRDWSETTSVCGPSQEGMGCLRSSQGGGRVPKKATANLRLFDQS